MIRGICWSSLQHLDLGSGPLGFLIGAITGLLPQLTPLSMYFVTAATQVSTWGPKTATMRVYVRSINSLQEASIGSYGSLLATAMWPTILYAHGKYLRKLMVYWKDVCGNPGLKDDQVEFLTVEASNLEAISLQLALVHDMEYTESVRFSLVCLCSAFDSQDIDSFHSLKIPLLRSQNWRIFAA
jgi:hypothetical protein